MKRREFIRLGAAGTAALTLGGLSLPEPARSAGAWLARYRAALPDEPWLLGVDAVPDEQLRAPVETLSGELPADLAGTLYRNGPALHHLGGRRYHHWFDADGMIQAFRMRDGRISHHGRYVATHKHRRETAAGMLHYPAFGTRFADAWPVDAPDEINAANTSVLPFDGRDIAAGPVYLGALPYALPLGFHGNYGA